MTRPARTYAIHPIPAALRDERNRQGRSQAWIAHRLSVSQNTVSRWDSGHTSIPLDMAVLYAQALDYTLDLRPTARLYHLPITDQARPHPGPRPLDYRIRHELVRFSTAVHELRAGHLLNLEGITLAFPALSEALRMVLDIHRRTDARPDYPADWAPDPSCEGCGLASDGEPLVVDVEHCPTLRVIAAELGMDPAELPAAGS